MSFDVFFQRFVHSDAEPSGGVSPSLRPGPGAGTCVGLLLLLLRRSLQVVQ